MISVKNLCKDFQKADGTHMRVIDGLNYDVEKGEKIVVVGPSGSGKSTFLRCLNLLERPTSGQIFFDGEEITAPGVNINKVRERMGMVFQNFNLLSKITAQQNVALPLVYAGVPEEERMERARVALRDVGLEDRMDHKPNELSGGQRQRVAIARALVNNPAIVMADEPTGNLDTKSSYEIMEIFKKLNAMGKTIVMVTHEPDIGQQTKRILVMRDGHLNSDERLVHDYVQ